MNIQRFSQLTKISTYTIRYYEKIGLLKLIQRNSSGHRCFTKEDIVWLKFIKRLKDTGMSLSNIKKFADLRVNGSTTFKARMELLQQHAIQLEAKIISEQLHFQKIKEKIEYYKNCLFES